MPLWERIKSIFGFDKTRTQSSEIPNLDVFLYELLGYQPQNIEIYEKAFIHRSAQVKDEHGNDVNFERLEFLGDAVLGLIIAVYIFEKAPHKQEGY